MADTGPWERRGLRLRLRLRHQLARISLLPLLATSAVLLWSDCVGGPWAALQSPGLQTVRGRNRIAQHELRELRDRTGVIGSKKRRDLIHLAAGVLGTRAASILVASPCAHAGINPLRLYGKFCGPNPEINQEKTSCMDPYNRDPIDDADAVCKRHDLKYCKCDMELTKRGNDRLKFLGSDKGPFMALRALVPDAVAKQFVDPEYIRCLHRADIDLTTERQALEDAGKLPSDPAALTKMQLFKTLFEADLKADERWLADNGGI